MGFPTRQRVCDDLEVRAGSVSAGLNRAKAYRKPRSNMAQIEPTVPGNAAMVPVIMQIDLESPKTPSLGLLT